MNIAPVVAPTALPPATPRPFLGTPLDVHRHLGQHFDTMQTPTARTSKEAETTHIGQRVTDGTSQNNNNFHRD
jgi:hypothetical protein